MGHGTHIRMDDTSAIPSVTRCYEKIMIIPIFFKSLLTVFRPVDFAVMLTGDLKYKCDIKRSVYVYNIPAHKVSRNLEKRNNDAASNSVRAVGICCSFVGDNKSFIFRNVEMLEVVKK
mmetsp:Transcript_24961/g.68831  ORF Transcript_24961/g.68831 Transcript_24961/m.68831 type:complete len:118 (+) Transcript_24961:3893-4246(+)